ncbi:ABC transporter ATP-binding protein [Neorhizobium sp. T786]|uniref:ABC transporter ATP-binding protein n=1 Tax=Pseudorhizobium xiangyangii TaxID=2883104 RepID=UPI001D0011DD|nr:ABC transporter ATP-binding protein [Neorhizobium xiangyangii]MCB5204041.1 ABC transporter ATP-binding protein [Neorhizobium xiangyangii]
MKQQALLQVSLPQVSLGPRVVLKDITFSVGAGEIVGLLGPNGAGKSTLLRAICGLIAFHGKVTIDGSDVTALRGRERAAKVAYVAQEHDVAWPIKVAELVALGRTSTQTGLSARLSDKDRRAVQDAMRLMDITELSSRPANALSGGEKARALIARALAQEAPLLLADEPAAGLDPAHQINLMKTFRTVAADGRAVMLSMHDLGLAARWCTRLILLDRGAIVADGPPEAVLQPGNINKVYGVSAHVATVDDGLVVQVLDSLRERPA